MYQNFNLWTLAFIVSFSFLIAAIIVGWVSLREFWIKKNIRSLYFGVGLVVIGLSNLFISLVNVREFTIWSLVTYVIGFALILIAVASKPWHYLLLLIGIFPFLIPFNHPWFFMVLLGALPLSYFVHENFCKLVSGSENCDTENYVQGQELGGMILFAIVSLFLYSLAKSPIITVNREIPQLAGLFFEAISGMFLYYYILKSLSFTKVERSLLPVVLGAIITIVFVANIADVMMSGYITTSLKNNITEETGTVKMLFESRFPEDLLAKNVKNKSSELNDYADEILAKTGLIPVVFLDNERVASAPSATGKGRLIGTTLNDTKITDAVLHRGEKITAGVEKSGTYFIASYQPIYDRDVVIGMIATGKDISEIKNIQNQILTRTIFGVMVIVFISFAIVIYKSPFKR